MEENSGIVSFGPGTNMDAEQDTEELHDAHSTVDENENNVENEIIEDHQQDDQNRDENNLQEQMFSAFHRHMSILSENVQRGFEIMQNQMRNLIGTMNTKMELMQNAMPHLVNNKRTENRVDEPHVRELSRSYENSRTDFAGISGENLQRSNIQICSTPNDAQRNSNTNNFAEPCATRNSQIKMKPKSFSGKEDLEDYLAQFEIISDLNNWDYKTRSLYLASSLTDEARGLLSELSLQDRKDYDKIVNVLTVRFGSVNRAEVFRSELQSRTKRKDETLPELAQSVKKLTRKAYPSASSNVVETLALDYFIDAIPFRDIRIRLREVCPKTLAEAEKIAVRLDAVHISDRNRNNDKNKNFNVHSVGLQNDKVQEKLVHKMDDVLNKIDSVSNEVKNLKRLKSGEMPPNQGQRPNFNQKNTGNFSGFNRYNQRGNYGNRNGNRPFGRDKNFQSSENRTMSTSGGEVRQRTQVPHK